MTLGRRRPSTTLTAAMISRPVSTIVGHSPSAGHGVARAGRCGGSGRRTARCSIRYWRWSALLRVGVLAGRVGALGLPARVQVAKLRLQVALQAGPVLPLERT